MDYFKTKHRTNLLLKNWSKDQFWYKQDQVLHSNIVDNIQRVHIDKISIDQFIENFERASKPVII